MADQESRSPAATRSTADARPSPPDWTSPPSDRNGPVRVLLRHNGVTYVAYVHGQEVLDALKDHLVDVRPQPLDDGRSDQVALVTLDALDTLLQAEPTEPLTRELAVTARESLRTLFGQFHAKAVDAESTIGAPLGTVYLSGGLADATWEAVGDPALTPLTDDESARLYPGPTGKAPVALDRAAVRTATTPTRVVVRDLLDALGAPLVAVLAASRDAKSPYRWAREDGPTPRQATTERLRTAHRIWTALTGYASIDDDTARTWFVGLNPSLGETSPVRALHEGRTREVLHAAEAFLDGTWSS